jgi:hypothetical protein
VSLVLAVIIGLTANNVVNCRQILVSRSDLYTCEQKPTKLGSDHGSIRHRFYARNGTQ